MLLIETILQRTAKELYLVSESPELDARVLLEAAIEKSRSYIFAHSEAPITNADYAQFRRFIRRRKNGEPVAYILGHKEFYGLDFVVNKNVLIPRPESEWLVEEGLNRIKRRMSEPVVCNRQSVIRILDIGAGSGNLVISLAKETKKRCNNGAMKQFVFYALDISTKALRVAKKNAAIHGVKDQIKFYCSDLFSNPKLPKKFDLIIANLPYVPIQFKAQNQRSRAEESTKFEPQDAIFATDNGTATIKSFLVEAKDRISDDGLILLELDPRNAKELGTFAKNHFPNSRIELQKDLAGLNRYLIINKTSRN